MYSSLEPVVKIKGTVIDLAEYSAYRYGYTFDGWYADEALTQRVTSVTLDADKTVYAAWTRNRFFEDVTIADWFYDDVMYAYDRGLICGTAYNKFSPKDSFTRGMLLTILARHDGVRTKDSTPWYASGCDWAARNGISDGKNPEEAVSREEFALILYRYAQYRGSSMLSGNDLSSFTDANAVTDEALPAVQWAVSEAILRGDNFYLHPQSGATRAEAAAMLHRFFAR